MAAHKAYSPLAIAALVVLGCFPGVASSAARGPQPGKPVVLGSGMRGDRVSVVFTSPAEIGIVREGILRVGEA